MLRAFTGCLFLAAAAFAADELVLGDFEKAAWPGLIHDTKVAKIGKGSGKWENLPRTGSIRIPSMPKNCSQYSRIVFWMHSAKANDQKLTLVCSSDNPANGAREWDYFFYHFKVNWTGWKKFDLKFNQEIRGTRKPRGWDQIDYCSFNTGGWGNTPKPDTVLHFDDVKLVRDVVGLKATRLPATETSRQAWQLAVTNHGQEPHAFALQSDAAEKSPFVIDGLPAKTKVIPAGKTATYDLLLRSGKRAALPPLARFEFAIQARTAGAPDSEPAVVLVSATQPLARRQHPFLVGGPEIYQRALARAKRHDWAKGQVDHYVKRADGILESELVIPDEGGQWSHHYVCKKKCGGRLTPKDGKHICKRCDITYTGWPFDQVLIGHQHGGNWASVRDLGLAYAFTGKEAYAERAREVLLGYVAKYKTYPIHNYRGQKSRSGARIYAQTLDESSSIIPLCWGYDLVYNSPAFSQADHEAIADEFLREVAATIRRHNAGISNWQSWHNAGVAAIGFVLQDPDLASLALKQKRGGFEYQLDKSILPDGFWYEGTAAYHYYALSALQWTAELAHFAGIDYWSDKRFQSLYSAPLEYTFPNLSFPAVNDSDVFSIRGRHSMYELAYARTGKASYLSVAQFGARRSLNALLWGPDELPPSPKVALPSRDFQGLGSVVLRNGSGPDQLYVHLDYGPHGGGHGHPDKLALIVFSLGKQLAPDPARLAYGAPLHGSWYRQTFAHNTVCVDERSQAFTTGKLEFTHFTPELAVAQGSSSGANKGVLMRRRVALFGGLVLDVFEVSSDQEHTYDYLYHNFGELQPGLDSTPRKEPLATKWGYQHLTDIRSAKASDDWSATFAQKNANVRLLVLGQPETELFFGMGMANNPPKPCPMTVVRRRGKTTRFVALIEPYRDQPTVTGFRQMKTADGALAFEILRGKTRDRILLADQATQRTFGGIETDARAVLVQDTRP